MKLKKNLLVSVAAVALLSAGAGIVSQESNTQVVEAKAVSKKLTHNAAVYNSKGKRTHAKTLKKGKKVRVYGTKNIKGKKYYRIGKNKYVKIANFAKPKKKASHKKQVTGLQAAINKNSFQNPIVSWHADLEEKKESEKTAEVKAIRDTTVRDGRTGSVVKTFKAGTTFWITSIFSDKDVIVSELMTVDVVNPLFFKAGDLEFTGYKPNNDPKIKKMNAEIKALKKDGDAIDIYPNDLNEPIYEYDETYNLRGKAIPFKDSDSNYEECQQMANYLDQIVPVKINGEYYYCFSIDDVNYVIKANNVKLEADTMDDDDE